MVVASTDTISLFVDTLSTTTPDFFLDFETVTEVNILYVFYPC